MKIYPPINSWITLMSALVHPNVMVSPSHCTTISLVSQFTFQAFITLYRHVLRASRLAGSTRMILLKAIPRTSYNERKDEVMAEFELPLQRLRKSASYKKYWLGMLWHIEEWKLVELYEWVTSVNDIQPHFFRQATIIAPTSTLKPQASLLMTKQFRFYIVVYDSVTLTKFGGYRRVSTWL